MTEFRRVLRQALKLAGRGLLALGVALLLYFGLAFLGACWPRNRDFVSAPEGIPIWVVAGPIHTDVVVPVKTAVFDWGTLVDAEAIKTPSPALDHLAIGWGDRKFYLETPTWQDVKVRNVLSAFCGLDATAMHVEWRDRPLRASPNCRALILTPAQYTQLCTFVSSSFRRDASGRGMRIDAPGYGASDAFYEAEGRYSALRTCNTWTGDALAFGGVRVGVWTPTSWGVLWQLPQP